MYIINTLYLLLCVYDQKYAFQSDDKDFIILWENYALYEYVAISWIIFDSYSTASIINQNIQLHNTAMIDEPPPRTKVSPWGNYMKSNENIFESRSRKLQGWNITRWCVEEIICRTMTFMTSHFFARMQNVRWTSNIIEKSASVLGRNVSRVYMKLTFQRSLSRLIIVNC